MRSGHLKIGGSGHQMEGTSERIHPETVQHRGGTFEIHATGHFNAVFREEQTSETNVVIGYYI